MYDNNFNRGGNSRSRMGGQNVGNKDFKIGETKKKP